MSISFNTIPGTWRLPMMLVELDPSRAGVGGQVRRTLLVGQASTGLGAVPVPGFSVDQVRALAGRGSMLARMYEKARLNDPTGEIWILALADAGESVAATITLECTGPSTAAGVVPLWVAGQAVPVVIASGAAATAIATALAAAVNAKLDLPVTAAVDGGATTHVILTARHTGAAGNGIDVRTAYLGVAGGEAMPAGVGLVITPDANGATNPDLSGLDDLLGDMRFDYIAAPYTDTTSMASLKAFSAARWNFARSVRGHVFTALVDTAANLLTFGAAHKSDPHVTVFGVEAMLSPAWEIAGAAVGTIGVAIRADAARPLQTLQVLGLTAPPRTSWFKVTVAETMLEHGIAQFSFDDDGTARIRRAVTTYQVNADNQADASMLDCETLFTWSEVTDRVTARMSTKFPRHKLADNGSLAGPGQAVVTPNSWKAELFVLYTEMERDGIVDDAAAMRDATVVERNASDPSRLDVLFVPHFVSGLRVTAIRNQFVLAAALNS